MGSHFGCVLLGGWNCFVVHLTALCGTGASSVDGVDDLGGVLLRAGCGITGRWNTYGVVMGFEKDLEDLVRDPEFVEETRGIEATFFFRVDSGDKLS